MKLCPTEILSVLDKCCGSFTFPMLDNGYVYPAATRLSLFRSPDDWAMVIEVFGFSPRSGVPDTHIHTFGSCLRRQKSSNDYVSQQAYEVYLSNNPNNESMFVFPLEEGEWQDAEDCEVLAPGQHKLSLRGSLFDIPPPSEYQKHGITLQEPPNVYVFELCRLLAAMDREDVLATSEERRACVPAALEQVMQLEEWHHPDVVIDEMPSATASFKLLAEVLYSGNPSRYKPVEEPNTHWSNWPDGGTL